MGTTASARGRVAAPDPPPVAIPSTPLVFVEIPMSEPAQSQPAWHQGFKANVDPNAIEAVTGDHLPVEQVEVPAPMEGDTPLPAELAEHVAILVIHDGAYIPPDFLVDGRGDRIPYSLFRPAYVRERDWGAALVAGRLAQALGLKSFTNVNIARVLMDFGRFPGRTDPSSNHMTRYAISHPFSQLLGGDQARAVLENYYDAISTALEPTLAGCRLFLAVHTYDREGNDGVLRPQCSVISRAMEGYGASGVPFRAFDPMFPVLMGEFTCDRVLRDRLSLTLEKAGLPTAHDYPYLLPEGSLEVRSQVWFFFDALHTAFVKRFPHTAGEEAYTRVWSLLMDTNLRSTETVGLRGYLHLFRRAPAGEEELYRACQRAYDHVRDFLDERDQSFLHEYRFSPARPSSLGVEIRKDLVFTFDERGNPVKPCLGTIDHVATTMATALETYFRVDRKERLPVQIDPLVPWNLADRP